MAEKHQCAGLVFNGRHYRSCRRKATTWEDHQWWCSPHAPSTVFPELGKLIEASPVLADRNGILAKALMPQEEQRT